MRVDLVDLEFPLGLPVLKVASKHHYSATGFISASLPLLPLRIDWWKKPSSIEPAEHTCETSPVAKLD